MLLSMQVTVFIISKMERWNIMSATKREFVMIKTMCRPNMNLCKYVEYAVDWKVHLHIVVPNCSCGPEESEEVLPIKNGGLWENGLNGDSVQTILGLVLYMWVYSTVWFVWFNPFFFSTYYVEWIYIGYAGRVHFRYLRKDLLRHRRTIDVRYNQNEIKVKILKERIDTELVSSHTSFSTGELLCFLSTVK